MGMMHGTMFVLLRRFIESKYNYSMWIKIRESAGITHSPYELDVMYPTIELLDLLNEASRHSGEAVHVIMEKYGKALVPDLILVYHKYINPNWRTYDMILLAESHMHSVVKKEDNKKNPPMLHITKKGDKQLIIDYFSKRRMASVAVGIINGIAKHFDECDLVRVKLVTPAHEERVQIRVYF
jgi:hypothetical protein